MLTHPDEGLEDIIYPCAHRQHECTPRGQLAEGEQLLLTPNFPVIPLGRFFHVLLVLCHLLRVGKGDSVDPLESVVFGIAKEVGRGVLAISGVV